MASMQGKIVLITGGAKGLGKAMADRMAEAGARVVVTSRQTSTDAPLHTGDGTISEAYLDVTSESSVQTLFARMDEAYGRIDVLVNNAGIGIFKPVIETTLAEWEQVIHINLTGVFLCAREAFLRMKQQGGGRIINIASVSGYIPIVENGVYGASKYAVRGFSQILNEEGKMHNIRVSIVSPGAVYTDIWEGREGFSRDDMLLPEDIAETVYDIAHRPLHVRIDEVKILPPKGIL